jgi:hypothetical protein
MAKELAIVQLFRTMTLVIIFADCLPNHDTALAGVLCSTWPQDHSLEWSVSSAMR